ncbi:MAG: metallophosphoesterase [Planctomycetia bacterium]|nr:metallophosphoesterase [Planctomycetia bacterium]
MQQQLTRRNFITLMEAVGASMALNGFSWARAQEDGAVEVKVKKVDKLTEEPVLTIAHCCDPQLGFNKTRDEKVYQLHLARLKREIELVNESKPDVVFFAGDMAHFADEMKRDYPELLKKIETPMLVAVGNHDVPDPLTAKGVVQFTDVFGVEYNSLVVKGWKIIVFNSQYIRPTQEQELYDQQVEWFKRELEDAHAKNLKTILGSHVPPFVKSLDEKDEYFNFPSKFRQDFLDYSVSQGATFYLAGHTHTTLERAYRGMPILNAETTSVNFDQRPHGFRLLKIDANLNYEWNFIGLGEDA